MHVPHNKSLVAWIRELEAEGRLYRFYKTDEWLELKDEVMEDHHFECSKCEGFGAWVRDDSGLWVRSKGVFLRRAQTVHHEHEVRKRPDLALTRWALGPDGTRREILHPLCNRCHNEEHGRILFGAPAKPKLNAERW